MWNPQIITIVYIKQYTILFITDNINLFYDFSNMILNKYEKNKLFKLVSILV